MAPTLDAPAGVATEALAYLREGGPENLRELARLPVLHHLPHRRGLLSPHPMPPQACTPSPIP